MAELKARISNFMILRGNDSIRIGDGNPAWERNIILREFELPGPIFSAFLTYMVKGLTVATSNPEIRINNTLVGRIQRAEGANRNHWFTQTVTISHSAIGPVQLHQGQNEFEIRAVAWPGASADDLYDDFFLRNVILHYNYLVDVGPGLV